MSFKPQLLAYRARPVRPWSLAGACVAAALCGWWAIRSGAAQKPPADGFIFLAIVGVATLLGACTALVLAPDADRAERLLRSAPRSFLWTLALRFASWFAVAVMVTIAIAIHGAGPLRVTSGEAVSVGLTPLFLTTGVALVAGRLSATLIGAGVGLAAAAAYLMSSMLVPEWALALPLDPTRSDFAEQLQLAFRVSALVLAVSLAVAPLTLRLKSADI